MMTDPRAACGNARELMGWAILHDLVAHPLMALTLYSKPAMAFHDFTSHKAWPRETTPVMQELGPGIYAIDHPTVRHSFVTQAASREEAEALAAAWFERLADEFGGNFNAKELQ